MWRSILSIFRRRGNSLPDGVALRDASVDAAVESIFGRVVLQLRAVQPTPEQLQDNQSVLMGYVATFAELEAKKFADRSVNATAALISILVTARMSGDAADHEQLMNEFAELEQSRDYSYGQGGAMALEDYESSAAGKAPHALALWMRAALYGKGVD
jgi:hypothetical protein